MSASPVTLYIPCDSGAVSVGADAVAREFAAQCLVRNLPVHIVRTGSRGMYWLEPLVEVQTGEGRVGYGPLTAPAC
jgi:formate dehydrogenase iron-sulfur subunit